MYNLNMPFVDPEKNVALFGIKDGEHIADFGAGSGAYAFALSRRVGPRGMIYAVDIQKELLSKIKNEGNRLGLENIQVIWGDVEKPGGTKLGDASLDGILLSNILYQVSDKKAVMEEAKRVLKSGGKVFLIEWSASHGGLGPKPEDVFPKEEAKKLFGTAGFAREREIDAGSYHYGLIFSKI